MEPGEEEGENICQKIIESITTAAMSCEARVTMVNKIDDVFALLGVPLLWGCSPGGKSPETKANHRKVNVR